jgi:hypothetical protein
MRISVSSEACFNRTRVFFCFLSNTQFSHSTATRPSHFHMYDIHTIHMYEKGYVCIYSNGHIHTYHEDQKYGCHVDVDGIIDYRDDFEVSLLP